MRFLASGIEHALDWRRVRRGSRDVARGQARPLSRSDLHGLADVVHPLADVGANIASALTEPLARYHGYSQYFPLWALARYRHLKASKSRQVLFGI
jgi:hypothetical protein